MSNGEPAARTVVRRVSGTHTRHRNANMGPGTRSGVVLFPTGERGEPAAAVVDLPHGRLFDQVQQRLDVGAGAIGAVVPLDQVPQLLSTDRGRRAPVHRILRTAVDRVPGQVEGALHELGVGARHATPGVQDRAHEARPVHGDVPHALGRHEVDRAWLALRVMADEPRVLDPACPDDLPRGRYELADLGEFRQPGAEVILLGQPAPRPPPCAPSDGSDVRGDFLCARRPAARDRQ